MDLATKADDAALVEAARAGDGAAFGVLFDRWFDRVHDVAYRIVRDREVAAEVAQDTFLAAWQGLDRLEQVGSFGGWLLRIARNRALNRLERERRSVPVDDEEVTTVKDRSDAGDDEVAAEVGRAESAELVWAAAVALGPRDVSVLDLHLRHGLTPAEIAEELGVAPNAAHQALFRLRARLGDAVRAWALWRGGQPSCPGLRVALADAGVTAFGRDALPVVAAHAEACPDCADRQRARLAPEALFASAPLVVAGVGVRDAVRAALHDAGIPVGPPPGSATDGDGGGGGDDSDAPDGDGGAPGRGPTGGRPGRRAAIVVAAAGAATLVVVAVLVLTGDDGPSEEAVAAVAAATTPTTAATTSSPPSTAGSTTTTTGPPAGSLAPTTTAGPSPAPAPTSAPATTDPSADGGGPTTRPPTVVDPGTGTTTTSTSTVPPPPPEPPPAPGPPTIVSFTATRVAGPGCATPSARVVLSWTTTDADRAELTGTGAPAGTLPANGTAVACSPGPATYLLTATGPDGSANGSAVAT